METKYLDFYISKFDKIFKTIEIKRPLEPAWELVTTNFGPFFTVSMKKRGSWLAFFRVFLAFFHKGQTYQQSQGHSLGETQLLDLFWTTTTSATPPWLTLERRPSSPHIKGKKRAEISCVKFSGRCWQPLYFKSCWIFCQILTCKIIHNN